MTTENGVGSFFGENVFSIKTMRNYLSENAYKSLSATICSGKDLDHSIADEVADAMKTWALEKGATHYTHWFQPLTGATAEKHDSFVTPDHEGGLIMQFSGDELIKGEPDASSFPSGGLRATFEARGYTGWDPTSPAFIKEGDGGCTLCIPSVFCGYHGESLDKKTPLLRSMSALSKQVGRLEKLFGTDPGAKRAIVTLGVEQEYFLIDRELYEARPDLMQTGRTLFGRRPAKHQQLDDHYFGAIKPRVMEFMYELDAELWRMGIPAKTRHNEVCPAQFEIAPMFEEQNLAVDHNMVTMDILKVVADRHGFICLLHEKPFAGVNGSGKHNNWAVAGSDGKNLLSPGDNPSENAKFLTVISALIKAVDTHAALLRGAVASAENDHRLGANEAPPAVISIFLGDELTEIFENLETGSKKSKGNGNSHIEIGLSSLPPLPRDTTDRNRTSPLAFTGNKFEFRAVGSSQSCATANVVMNTIVADALDAICTEVEAAVADGKDLNEALQATLKDIIVKHKRILFNGDNYTDEWLAEAAKRGLPNLKSTPEALEAIVGDTTVSVFEKHNVLTKRELESRHEVYMETYDTVVTIEAECAAHMARTIVAPAALEYQALLCETIAGVEGAGIGDASPTRDLLSTVCEKTNSLLSTTNELEKAISDGSSSAETLASMETLREAADALEGLLPRDLWSLPSYSDLLFIQ